MSFGFVALGLGATATTATAVGVAGAGLIGSAVASNSAKKAAQTQADAATNAANIQADSANNALELQEKQYEQAREDAAPYKDVAQTALYNYADDAGLGGSRPEGYVRSQGFEATPEYQNAIKTGEAAIGRQAPVFASGQRLKALLDYNQNTARNFRNDRFNKLLSLIGVGTGTTGLLANMGQNFANNSGNLITGAGNAQATGINNAANAQATGILGSNNAISAGIKGAGNAFGQYLKNDNNSTAPNNGLTSQGWASINSPIVDTSPYSDGSGAGLGSNAWQSMNTFEG